VNTSNDRAVPDIANLIALAKFLFARDIRPNWGNRNSVWRTAWAMDTILDFYRLCGVDGASDGSQALEALNPTARGDWWDDFGWIGIAALRAAEQNTYPALRQQMLKIAINAWAYMYGPGWSLSPTNAIFPFKDDDLPGWSDFAVKHTDNIGTLNVWAQMDSTFGPLPPTPDQRYRQQPRYSPGGGWNSPIRNDGNPVPLLSQGRSAVPAYLNPAQNTVTNGLYAILTLRILRASARPEFGAVFDASGLNLRVCEQAWTEQAGWLNRWCTDPALTPAQTLTTNPEDIPGAVLFRERVSTFVDSRNGAVFWDAGYVDDLVWTGDQGLLLGVLREGAEVGTALPIFRRAQEIVTGVFHYGIADRRYGGASKAPFLLPWRKLSATGDARFLAGSPGHGANDDADYQTGVAVFLRYLLQAYEAAPDRLPAAFANTILMSAGTMLRPEFNPNSAIPRGVCDAFANMPGDEVNVLTPPINRLSILLMAIAIAKRGAAPGAPAS